MSAVRTRSSDQVLVEQAVVALGRSSPHTVAFGGLAHDGAVHVSAISGEHTQSIEGLVVREHRGLGGRAMVESRPRLALDYRTSRTITHDYDAAILGARIVTLVAVPVLVSGRPRGMLYCGSRRSAEIGGAIAQPTIAAADDLAAQLQEEDEATVPSFHEVLTDCLQQNRNIKRNLERIESRLQFVIVQKKNRSKSWAKVYNNS